VSGEVAEAAVDEIENAVVDFDPGHPFLIERQRRQHIPPATGSYDDHARVRPQVVRDVRDVVLQVGDLFRVAVKCRQLGPGVRIDVEMELVRGPFGRQRAAQAPSRRPDGPFGVAYHADA